MDKDFLWKPQLEIVLERSLQSVSPGIKEGDCNLDLGPDISKAWCEPGQTLGEHTLVADPTTKGPVKGGEG